MAAEIQERVPSIPAPAERKQLQSSFDLLVQSNFELGSAVRSLVRAGWVVMGVMVLEMAVTLAVVFHR